MIEGEPGSGDWRTTSTGSSGGAKCVVMSSASGSDTGKSMGEFEGRLVGISFPIKVAELDLEGIRRSSS